MSDEKYIELNNGKKMPSIFLGTWKSEPGKTAEAVKTAIRCGYRGVDCANDYDNEPEVGQALKELFDAGEVKREDIFIQAKLWNSNHRKEHVRGDLEATLKDLQIDYVDNYVIHWPQACPSQGKLAVRENGVRIGSKAEGTLFPVDEDGYYCSDNECHFTDTWEAMEELVDAGLTKSIGISNFNAAQVEELVSKAKKYKPVNLQNECHPYLQQKDLIDLCHIYKIVFQCYSPLGSGDRPWAKKDDPNLLEDPRLEKIAKKYNKSIAQVVLRWQIQRGNSLAAKSVTPSRIEENFQLFDFKLSDEDMKAFDAFNRNWRHLILPQTAMHPDYPFRESLPHDFKQPKAPKSLKEQKQ